MEGISKETLLRLPTYLRTLKELREEGEEYVSSTVIANRLNLSPIQVRKDIAGVSSTAGKPKTGFNVNELIEDMSEFLGFNDSSQAIIVGVGQLGKALMGYGNFKNYGVEIVAGFDTNTEIDFAEENGKPVYNINKLSNIVHRLGVHIGIITVPKENAQEVCDLLIKAGIRAIWNFAPVNLKVPDNIAIKNEDMAASLAVLSKRLSEILKNE